MLEKPATIDHTIHPLLRSRWSPRAFDPAPLPREQAPRTRKPLDAFAFGREWGQPSPLLAE